MIFVRDTIKWLVEAGFLRNAGQNRQDEYFNLVLSAKAFEILKGAPSALSSTKTLGEAVLELSLGRRQRDGQGGAQNRCFRNIQMGYPLDDNTLKVLGHRTRFTPLISPGGISPFSCSSRAMAGMRWSPLSSFFGLMGCRPCVRPRSRRRTGYWRACDMGAVSKPCPFLAQSIRPQRALALHGAEPNTSLRAVHHRIRASRCRQSRAHPAPTADFFNAIDPKLTWRRVGRKVRSWP